MQKRSPEVSEVGSGWQRWGHRLQEESSVVSAGRRVSGRAGRGIRQRAGPPRLEQCGFGGGACSNEMRLSRRCLGLNQAKPPVLGGERP